MYEANRRWIVLAYPAQSAIDKGPEADYFGFLTPAQLGATTTMSDEIASTHEVAKVAARFGREVRELLPRLKVGPGLSDSHAEAIRVHRRIGEIALKYVPEGTGGDKLFEALATAVGHRGSWLRRLRTFALEYTKREAEQLIRRAPRITFSHVIHLLSVHDKEMRKQLEDTLGKHQWTPDELAGQIQEKLGGPRRSGGRPIQFPTEVVAGLKRLLQDVKAIDRRWQEWRGQLAESPQLKLAETKSLLIELSETFADLSASMEKLTRKGKASRRN